jgi:hypothetical protein
MTGIKNIKEIQTLMDENQELKEKMKSFEKEKMLFQGNRGVSRRISAAWILTKRELFKQEEGHYKK